jgi:Ca2+-binding RTX toxin-like protein
LGGLGNDALLGGIGNDSIVGGAGNDIITYNFGDGTDVLVDGGADSDTLVVVGTAANNALSVTWNGTAITALTGITAITNMEHATASLGGGTDTLSYTTTSNVAVNLATGAATGFSTAAGSLTGAISGIENVTTGSGNDTLMGDAAANVLAGGAGNDTYFVGLGDTVTENNVVGIDTVNSTVSFTLGANVENLNLTALASINGTGNGGSNVITDLGGGDNVLSGLGGTDTLNGGAGADTLDGGAGNDVLIGGTGSDSMTGGGANDMFVFASGFGNDVITDFDANGNGTLANQDLLDISAYAGITAANFGGHVTIAVSLGNTIVTIDGTDQITLQGVTGIGNNVVTVTDFLLH